MKTRRSPAAAAAAASMTTNRRSPVAAAAASETTYEDTEVMDTTTAPIRAFFDTSGCNAATSKRIGGRTVIFSPTVVGAIPAHAGFSLTAKNTSRWACLISSS